MYVSRFVPKIFFSFLYSNHFNGFECNLDPNVIIQTSLYSRFQERGLKQEDQKFKAIFGYTENSRPA